MCQRHYVAGAIRMHVRSHSVAAATALLFVVYGVLAMHHEASTAHVRDRAGGFVHASSRSDHHASHDCDIHGQRDPEADVGDCALLTGFHQATSADFTAPAIIAAVRTFRAQDTPRTASTTAATDLYRVAPKTSPPAAV